MMEPGDQKVKVMKANILLIDDDDATQYGFSRYLSRAGYDIQTLSSLAEARQVLLSRYFDAVLLDMRLPDEKKGVSQKN